MLWTAFSGWEEKKQNPYCYTLSHYGMTRHCLRTETNQRSEKRFAKEACTHKYRDK